MYLGFIINGKGVRADPSKLDAIRKWPQPCTVSDVRSFLGFCNYHRKFIKDYASIAEPLIALTRDRVKFRWNVLENTSFEELRQALLRILMLPNPIPCGEFVLDTDATLVAIGGVLSQKDMKGKEHVVAFTSKTLTKSQRNYCATYRELLGVVEMVNHFCHYLWGNRFVIRTDHASLKWLKNYRNSDGLLARWLAWLAEYDLYCSTSCR